MALVCAVSGTSPEEPVYSSTGYIFERRLAEKHIQATGKCPVTGADMTVEELRPVHTQRATKPRPITAASIPGLLSLFQTEWDSVMSEVHVLRNHLDMVRNQLSHSLYQHDAATRVIARLVRERDASQQQISDLQKQLALANSIEGGSAEAGVSDELMAEMQQLAKQLLSSRKKRQVEGVASADDLKKLSCTGAFPLHSASTPGVLCCDIDLKPASEGDAADIASGRVPGRIATGGADGSVVYFDLAHEQTLSKLVGHLKKVNAVKIHPKEKVILSASEDKTIRVWKGDADSNQYKCAHTIRRHKGAVKGLTMHPLNEYFATCALDNSWAFFDLTSGRCLKVCGDLPCQYRCLRFHPDGMIVGGGGADGAIHIWDMKGAQFRASLSGHSGPICGMDFSENGYYLVTGSEDGTMRLWDLRKSLSFQTVQLPGGGGANAVTFDYSGHFVAAAGKTLSVHHFESRANTAEVVSLTDHSDDVTSVVFGPKAQYLVSTSKDRIVRLWQPRKKK